MLETKTENSFCTTCGHITTWAISKNHAICQGCKGIYPCKHKCNHWDCMESRNEAYVCPECGVLRTKDGCLVCPNNSIKISQKDLDT